MNVLIITSLYPTEEKRNLPKTTNAVHNLVKYWTAENRVVCIKVFRHTIMHPTRLLNKSCIRNMRTGYCDFFVKDGVEIYVIEYCLFPMQRKMADKQIKYVSDKINRIFADINFIPDIIISHMPIVDGIEQYIDKIKCQCPKVAVLHRSDIDYLDNEIHRRSLIENFTSIFTRSKSIYELACKFDIPNLSDKYVFSGVNTEIEVQERQWDELKQREIQLLYVGELIKQKAVDCIIEIVDKMPENVSCHLNIIGEGPERKRLEKLVRKKQLQKNVFFLGKQNRDVVYRQMAQADIFIMISKHETLGMVYLEAMRAGCITVGSKDEGIDGIIVNGENGFLVEPFKIQELENCVNAIINSAPGRLSEISKNAIETARYYNEAGMSRKYWELIKSI